MIDLDDVASVARADPGDMLGAVVGLANQCRTGYALGRALDPAPSAEGATAVVFCGMGGSAIAGDVLRALASDRVRAPVVVVRASELPAFVGPHTLVITSSYSGNTEETLALFEEARTRGSRVVALTSGGELASRADEGDVPIVRVPAGLMPRAAFGYLAMASVGALVAAGLLPSFEEDLAEALAELERIVGVAGPAVPARSNDAKALALGLAGRVPVVWAAEGFAAVAASRWKTQFNENAKVPAFASSLPELDHNEVVGWSAGQGDPFAVVALRHDGEDRDVEGRFPLSLEIAASSGARVEEVRASGRSTLARLLSLVQLGDLVSTYLGIARGVDPSPIDAIVRLKAALADA